MRGFLIIISCLITFAANARPERSDERKKPKAPPAAEDILLQMGQCVLGCVADGKDPRRCARSCGVPLVKLNGFKQTYDSCLQTGQHSPECVTQALKANPPALEQTAELAPKTPSAAPPPATQ